MIPFLNNLPDKVNALAENYLFFQLRSSRRNFLAFGATIIPRGITVKNWVDFKNKSSLKNSGGNSKYFSYYEKMIKCIAYFKSLNR